MIVWAAQTMVALTLILLLVLALRLPVARFLGAGWAYCLWLLPLLPFLMPVLHQAGASDLRSLHAISIPVPGAAFVYADSHNAVSLPLLKGLWVAGFMLFMVWQAVSIRILYHRLRNAFPISPYEHGGIRILGSGAVPGPLALGLYDRKIVVPIDFSDRYSPAERELVLDHELVHHRRGDLWWNLAATGLLGWMWCNPVAWIAYRAFRTDQELACDQVVTVRSSGDARRDYALAIVKTAARQLPAPACALNGAGRLKHRLRMMKRHAVNGARNMGGGAVFASALVFGLVISSMSFDSRANVQRFAVSNSVLPVLRVHAEPHEEAVTVTAQPVLVTAKASPDRQERGTGLSDVEMQAIIDAAVTEAFERISKEDIVRTSVARALEEIRLSDAAARA